LSITPSYSTGSGLPNPLVIPPSNSSTIIYNGSTWVVF
jgi:hypothetical protein